MKTHQYKIGRFRFATKLHIAFTATCMVMAITALVCALFNPFHLLYAGGFVALTMATYKEQSW
jgi:hypothetical protein